MTNNIRFDSIKLPRMRKTKEGYLQGAAVITKSGIFDYMNYDGSIRKELRHPDHIFKEDSLQKLKMIPITVDHPPEFLNSSNAHKYQIGHTGEVYSINEDQIIIPLTITHQKAIDAIESGKVELSLGYNVELKLEQGEYKGQKYDAIQLEPKYNHLALVDKGRAGSLARLRFDNACVLANVIPEKEKEINQKEIKMTKENTNQTEELKRENEQLTNKLNDFQIKLNELQNQFDKEKALKADDIIKTKVMDRAALIVKATPFLEKNDDLFNKTDRAIMEATISAVRTDATDFSSYSDEYLKGLFEASTKIVKTERIDAAGNIVKTMQSLRNDHEEDNPIGQQLLKLMKDSFYNSQYGEK